MLRDFSLRDFDVSLNTVESYTNESSFGKIGLCETVNKQKCTHLGMFLASAVQNSNLNTSDMTPNTPKVDTVNTADHIINNNIKNGMTINNTINVEGSADQKTISMLDSKLVDFGRTIFNDLTNAAAQIYSTV